MQYVQSTSNVNANPTGSTAGTALAANAARVFYKIQNIGVNQLYVLLGAGTASVGNCHEILKASATANDGTGGVTQSSAVCYTGPISVGGTAPSYLVTEIAP